MIAHAMLRDDDRAILLELHPQESAALQGSGLVIVNSPWQFDAELATAMQHIVNALGRGVHSVAGQRR